MRLTAHFVGVESAVAELERAFDDGAADGMERGSALVAAEARARHRFTNRTTNLERSIKHMPPFGRASDGTLAGLVVAEEDYASYVEANPAYAFLGPAWAARQAEAARVMDLALQRALNGAR